MLRKAAEEPESEEEKALMHYPASGARKPPRFFQCQPRPRDFARDRCVTSEQQQEERRTREEAKQKPVTQRARERERERERERGERERESERARERARERATIFLIACSPTFLLA